MFEFKGTVADSTEGNGPEWRLVDHNNIQDLGRRPFTTMLLPTLHQQGKTEGARRPSLPLRSRSNSSAPSYPRPQDKDDLSPEVSLNRRAPPSPDDRRSLNGGATHTRGDSLDTFTPKGWMAKGSRFLKRQSSKHEPELTSLRTLDWVEDSEEARIHRRPPPPDFRHSRMRSAAALRYDISEPFNFQHVTHTQRSHVKNLEEADSNELVSVFSALRASQPSRPELRGIKAKDIHREDLPRDALLPDCPSQVRNGSAGLPPFQTYRVQDHAPDSPSGATSPARVFEYSRLTDNFSQPNVGHHTAQTSPISPHSRTSSRHLTPDFFTFHDDSHSDATFESPIPTESPEPLDYSSGAWNDGFYDLASPHAVTTDDGADWNRPVPFSMVKTELAPVEEDDESEENRSSIASSIDRQWMSRSGFRKTKSSPSPNSKTFYWGLDAYMQAEKDRGYWHRYRHQKPSADKSGREWSTRPLPVEDSSSHKDRMVPYETTPHGVLDEILEPSIENTLDDIPVRSRFSRCISVGPNDMDGFWDIASDAISCSYALGAEGDSNFDWHRCSIHEDEMTASPTNDLQSKAGEHEPPSLSMIAARRSSSVYSSPSKLDPPSATSTVSSYSSVPEAITPNETTESATAMGFSDMNCKEWSEPAYIVNNDLESQMVQEDLYHQMYAIGCAQEAPFQIHNVGRIDGSTISNSPRSSRSPISKSSSQESFRFSQAALNARRPRNAGSVGSLPELMSSKNSREKFDSAVDPSTDNLTGLKSSESSSDSQQTSAAQRRRSPNLAKDVAQNIILSKVRTAEEPLPLPPASRERAPSDVIPPTQDSSMPSSSQPAAGRRMRSGSSASNLSARSSMGRYSTLPPPHNVTSVRSP